MPIVGKSLISLEIIGVVPGIIICEKVSFSFVFGKIFSPVIVFLTDSVVMASSWMLPEFLKVVMMLAFGSVIKPGMVFWMMAASRVVSPEISA